MGARARQRLSNQFGSDQTHRNASERPIISTACLTKLVRPHVHMFTCPSITISHAPVVCSVGVVSVLFSFGSCHLCYLASCVCLLCLPHSRPHPLSFDIDFTYMTPSGSRSDVAPLKLIALEFDLPQVTARFMHHQDTLTASALSFMDSHHQSGMYSASASSMAHTALP